MSMRPDFEKRLNDKAQQVEEVLKKYLPKEEGYARQVIEAMNYSILAGGKRLRPMMLLESYRMFAGEGADETVAESFAAAMEMIHTYSLVHDDLPAMDNDEYRRGRKTTHAVYGAGMATLAGDGLLNFAFETAISGCIKSADVDRERCLKALSVLATKAGIYGMVGGQCADIMAENSTETDETRLKDVLNYIDENKTGALIESSLMIGAILGGADSNQVSLIEKAGSNVGIAFQIQDDILDITSTQEELGKPIGSDEKNGKSTYVKLYGMEASRDKVRELSQEAEDILSSLGFQGSFLSELFDYLINRKK